MEIWDRLETLGYLFYAVSPNRTSFETVDEVPDYTVQVIPYFFALFVLEQVFMKMRKKRTARVNDTVGSLSQGMLSELTRILLHTWKFAAYIYIYSNWRIVTLPWNSLWTWWICFFATDFLYYWGHRASHEINFLWAAHQVHHSSEDYNLITALRQSVLQSYFLLVTNLPMALAIPPSVFLVHNSFNLLYQFWIHTEAIQSIGPLEYVLNTASHHRVHHGRNRYCIDKNYAGILIIWDRMFGTFEPESKEVVYGLTHPINSFESFYIQMCHNLHIWRTAWSVEGWKNKLSVLFKGPGWSAGKPWHGCIEDIPDVKAPAEKYDPPLPQWCKLYAVLHVVLLAFIYIETVEGYRLLPGAIMYGIITYQVLTASIIGMLLEGRVYVCWLELFRCIVYIAVDYFYLPYTRLSSLSLWHQAICVTTMRLAYAASAVFWLRQCFKTMTITIYKMKKS